MSIPLSKTMLPPSKALPLSAATARPQSPKMTRLDLKEKVGFSERKAVLRASFLTET
jgi:hypothetical protein